MGVKNPKVFTPKVVLDPNSIFKNHYFVTYKPHLSLTEVTWTYLGSEGFFERDFEISKKNLHPAHAPYGGMFLEVKNSKNRTPKVIFHPNRIFKSHQFVVMLVVGSFFEGTPTHIKSTLKYQKKFYTRHMSHMGACFWK